MAGATTSTHSAIIRPNVNPAISDAVFRNGEFISLFRQRPSGGGATLDLKLIVSANGSVQVYVEDQAIPSAGYQQVVTAQVPWKSFRVFTRMTGHLRRELGAVWDGNSWPGAYGGMDIEEEKAKEDLADVVNTTFLADAAYGLLGIVDDDTTNFFGLSRSTYTALKSYVKTASAALSASLLDRLITSTYDQPYGGRIEVLLMSPVQARKYAAIIHGKLAAPMRMDVGGVAIGDMPDYAGIPVVVIRDLANTEIVGLSGRNTDWEFVIHESAPGGIDILDDRDGDAMVRQYSTAGALVCTRPNRQGKLESLGTT